MGVTAEAAQEKLHLLVDHGVVRDQFGKLGFAIRIGQIAVQQQVTGFHEIAIGRQLLNGVTAVKQLALVSIDISDRRLT